jgi:hypothetical protein
MYSPGSFCPTAYCNIVLPRTARGKRPSEAVRSVNPRSTTGNTNMCTVTHAQGNQLMWLYKQQATNEPSLSLKTIWILRNAIFWDVSRVRLL